MHDKKYCDVMLPVWYLNLLYSYIYIYDQPHDTVCMSLIMAKKQGQEQEVANVYNYPIVLRG